MSAPNSGAPESLTLHYCPLGHLHTDVDLAQLPDGGYGCPFGCEEEPVPVEYVRSDREPDADLIQYGLRYAAAKIRAALPPNGEEPSR